MERYLFVRNRNSVALFLISLFAAITSAMAAPPCEDYLAKNASSGHRDNVRDILLNHNAFKNSKNETFINELWNYFHKNVWTKNQSNIADQLVELSGQKDPNQTRFVDLLKALRDSSETHAKNFVDFEKHPREYLLVLQRGIMMDMEFYGPKHVILFIATSNAWDTKVAAEVADMARFKASLTKSKADILKLPNPPVSTVQELKLIEEKISKALLTKSSWNERQFQELLSILNRFKKGVEYYAAGKDAESKQIVESAINSLVALTSTNPEMRPISRQDAYLLLSQLSGGSLNIQRADSELVLTAVTGMAKSWDEKLAHELDAYVSLRMRLEVIHRISESGGYAEKSMDILKLSPEEIF